MLERIRGRMPRQIPWYSNLEQVPIYTPPTFTNHTGNSWPQVTQGAAIDWLATNTLNTTMWPAYDAGTTPIGAWSTTASSIQEPLTQEEADRRLAATRAAAHKSAIRRKKAVKKGRRLLLEVLTEAQQEEYARTKSFTVCGADGKVYKLRKGGTTHQIDEGGLAILSHCIHLPYSYIDEDTLVAVKLILETDPDTFLKIANTSRLAASPIGIAVPGLPQEMADRAAALARGLRGVNERFAQLSIAAAQARDAAALLGQAFREAGDVIREAVDVGQARLQNAVDYGDYAREFESLIVAEETGGLNLPFAARQNHAARLLGHAEDIAGVQVAA